jgi:D-xylose transport system ATP-binding protein
VSSLPLLSLRGVSKQFAAVHALRDVVLEIQPGKVVEWQGRPVHIRRPQDAQHLGIAAVYQDLALCDNLDVVANLFLGREIRRFGVLDEVEMERRARDLLDGLAIRIPDLRSPVASLSGGQRQTVAISRSFLGGPKLLLLDEPTAALGVQQTTQVLDLIDRLRDRGAGVLLVSHNMGDVKAVADEVAVLRLGRNNGLFDVTTASQEQIISAITGASGDAVTRDIRHPGEADW